MIDRSHRFATARRAHATAQPQGRVRGASQTAVGPKRTRRSFLSTLGTVTLGATSLTGASWVLSGCRHAPMRTVRGETMGTYFNVVIADDVSDADMARVTALAKHELAQFTAQVSAYERGSELAQLNEAAPGIWQDLGGTTASLLGHSEHLSRRSEGAFDATIGPLAELWGFGPAPRKRPLVPSAAAIRDALALIGFSGFELDLDNGRARRLHPDVKLDVDGIGKGYGVDALTAALTRFGLAHFLVEIGGEIRARGRRASGDAWRIGIANPDGEAPSRQFTLTDQGVATSGDYQQFFELDGRRYSHLLDPRTGFPIQGRLSSVTVLAEDTVTADALSTALAVMGLEAGLAYADRHAVAAFFLYRDAAGLAFRESAAFAVI